ncbi:hypothetical protein ACKF11_08870 [Methylobacillus sp. Pita2]|uniref:hypothetical protein n=1 Tax=Methylobacillus sp. Pita2 TaxID=3383245 RepID=UPI0038B559B0
MADIVKIPGVRITLAGQDYILPPLTLNAVVQLRPRLETFKAAGDLDSIETVIDAAHAALLRNYPDLTREQVGEMVDMGNMADVMQACMDVSGLMRKQQEAGAGE